MGGEIAAYGYPGVPVPAPAKVDGDKLFAKISRRLLPILFVCYVIAYVDRVNIGFAKLQMMSDLHFIAEIYGFGAGVFFLAFIIFEVPSNLLLYRLGARVWIARIMVTWGIVSILMLFVKTPWSFYGLRFLLGAAEAGFLPGLIYYLTQWYPQERQGRIFSILILGAAAGGILVGPVSGWIMGRLNDFGGLRNWQWLFLIQGLPAVIMGGLLFRLLDDGPRTAVWLLPAERDYLAELLSSERAAQAPKGDIKAALREPKVWLLGIVMVVLNLGIYACVFWTPTIIKAAGFASYRAIGWLSMLPYIGAGLVLIGLGWSSDFFRERRWHIVGACLVGAAGLLVSGAGLSIPIMAIGGLVASTAVFIGVTPLIWALATTFITGPAAVVGFAIINALAAVGAFLGPSLMGLAQTYTGSISITFYVIAALTIAAGVVIARCAAGVRGAPFPVSSADR
ncbi:MAG TPA: MFS transporter [Steroidobacteraceae bacterium]|nr:MFS transporter [Steroidobacteraceae bacterium]